MEAGLLKAWLVKFWTDPVGSKLIAAGFLALPSGLVVLLSTEVLGEGVAHILLWLVVIAAWGGTAFLYFGKRRSSLTAPSRFETLKVYQGPLTRRLALLVMLAVPLSWLVSYGVNAYFRYRSRNDTTVLVLTFSRSAGQHANDPDQVTNSVFESLRVQILRSGFADVRLKQSDYSVDANTKDRAQGIGLSEGANIVVSGWYNPMTVVIYISVIPKSSYVPLTSQDQPFYLALQPVEALEMAAPKSTLTDNPAAQTAQLAIFISALTRLNARDYSGAVERLTDVLKRSTQQRFIDSSAIYFLRGTALALVNRFDESVADLTKVLDLDPKSSDALNNRGIAQIQRGRVAEGLADFAATDGINLSNPYFLINRALAHAAAGDTDAAIVDCTAALRSDPKFSLAFNNRGLAYLMKNDPVRALDDFNRALSVLRSTTKEPLIIFWPDTVSTQRAMILTNIGTAELRKNDIKAAILNFTNALKQDPQYYLSRYMLGRAYEETGEIDSAIQQYNQALKTNPGFSEALYAQGVLHDRRKEQDIAISYFDRAIAVDNSQAAYYLGRGQTLEEKGEINRAIADYTWAISLSPRLAVAHFLRGNAYLRQGKDDPKTLAKAIIDLTAALGGTGFEYSFSGRGLYFRDSPVRVEGSTKDLSTLAREQLASAYFSRALSMLIVATEAKINREKKLQRVISEVMPNTVKGSIRDLDQAIQLRPEYADAYYFRGIAYENLGECSSAMRDFTVAVNLSDKLTNFKRNDPNTAIQELRKKCRASR